jgi:enoyl-CoA hydratase/carnithine racemase
MPRAMEMARVLASKPRGALFETKRLTRELIDMDTSSALEEIGSTFLKCLESEEHRRQVAQVFESLKKK